MADVELCYAPLLDTLEYAASVGATFHVDLDDTYKKTLTISNTFCDFYL